MWEGAAFFIWLFTTLGWVKLGEVGLSAGKKLPSLHYFQFIKKNKGGGGVSLHALLAFEGTTLKMKQE